MYRRIALGSPYILTEYDVTIEFRSAANRTNVSIFASWPRKWGPTGPTVVNAFHNYLIKIFWKTTETAEAENSQIRRKVVLKSLYIATGNDVIGFFWSATNSASATGTTANFRVRKVLQSTILTTVALVCVVALCTAPPVGGLSCF